MKEEWREIENCKGYLISNTGKVLNTLTGKIRKTFKSNRGYERINLPLDDGGKLNRSIHVMVINAFGKPEDIKLRDGHKYQINHKDGNKYNNHISNLEAVSASENVKHAFKEGLRKDNFKCILEDIKEGTKKNFISLEELSKYLKISNDTLIAYIPRSSKYPINGRYKITAKVHFTGDSDRLVYVLDHMAGEVKEYNNLYHASFATGIVHTSFSKDLLKQDTKYIGGYTFSYKPIDTSKITLDLEDKERAQRDRTAIWSKPIKKICNGIRVYDPVNGTITEYQAVTDFANKLNVKPRTISAKVETAAKKFNRAGIFSGYVITRLCDDYPLKDIYTNKQLILSKHGKSIDGKLYKLNNRYIYSRVELAKELGLTIGVMASLNNRALEEKYGVETID